MEHARRLCDILCAVYVLLDRRVYFTCVANATIQTNQVRDPPAHPEISGVGPHFRSPLVDDGQDLRPRLPHSTVTLAAQKAECGSSPGQASI